MTRDKVSVKSDPVTRDKVSEKSDPVTRDKVSVSYGTAMAYLTLTVSLFTVLIIIYHLLDWRSPATSHL